MLRRAAALLAAGSLCAGAPQTAAAQEPPRDAAVVAGPTASGATLVAWDRGTQLCIAIRHGGTTGPEGRAPAR